MDSDQGIIRRSRYSNEISDIVLGIRKRILEVGEPI